MTDPNVPSFWSEGPKELRNAMSERRSRIDRLVTRLRGAFSRPERDAVESELRDVLDEYEVAEKDMDQCLFLLR